MPFSDFQSMISHIASALRVDKVYCHHNTEKGLYMAVFPDDTVATCNPTSTKLTFQNGRYHTYQIPIAVLVGAI